MVIIATTVIINWTESRAQGSGYRLVNIYALQPMISDKP